MSEISLYPQGIDIFTTKVDSTNGLDGDYIMAEDVNKLQNAISAVELSLGINPQGTNVNVAQALTSLSKSRALSLPRVQIYTGDPLVVNSASNIDQAVRHFSYLSIAILDGIDVNGTLMSNVTNVITKTREIGPTYFYGTIDAGVSTANISLESIQSMVSIWENAGVNGIYFKNFGYDTTVSRERQNSLIAIAHAAGLSVMVSATNIDDVFGVADTSGLNPNAVATSLTSGDSFLALGYVVNGQYYQNAAELRTLSQKMVDARSAFGVSIYGVGYLSDSDTLVEQYKKSYYAQAVAMAYSLDGFDFIQTPTVNGSIPKYRSFPIVGDYYDRAPFLTTSGNSVVRVSDIGSITFDSVAHTYSFSNIKIPLSFIDFEADDTLIDASRLSGALPNSVTFDVISRINSSTSRIASDRYDISGTSVITAINLVSGGTTKISLNALENHGAMTPDEIIALVDQRLEDALISGSWDGNFRRLTAAFISGINAHFNAVVAEGGTFSGLDAGAITAGHIDSGLISTNTITSDKLSIVSNAGVNKWAGVIVNKDVPGVVTVPHSGDVNGKDVFRRLEVVDTGSISTSSMVGSSAIDYIAYWKTYVYCSETFTRACTFRANSNATLAVNGVNVVTALPNTNHNYTMNLVVGWNFIEVCQDHNSETSCEFNIGIKLSDYALQTETGKDSNGATASPTPVVRVDAYAENSTQIVGDIIKTGTIDATAITSHTITAEQVQAHAITANEIQAGTITATELDVNNVNAAIVNAGVVDAIEAYIQHLEADDGSFKSLLADILSSKFINANNIAITSEAKGINGDTGILRIDNGGLVVSNLPKDKVAISNEVMTVVADRVYRTVHMPVCEDPAPVFSLRDASTLIATPLARDDYELIYEYGQITIDTDISLANKDLVAIYSYYAQYYPTGARVVRIDRDGISISNDGGRPGTWTTKLDGNRLYVGSIDINNAAIQTAHIGDAQVTNAKIDSIDAGKITTGTLTASESVTVSAGAGAIVLDERGLTSTNFTIGTDGNATFSGTVTALTGSRIANWYLGTDTIYDFASKIVMNSAVPSINIDSGKVILGKYDATNYGIKAIQGLIGNVQIDSEGLVIGTGSIVDTRDAATRKLHISSDGVIAGNISATSGTINGIQITPEGIAAFTAPAQPDIVQNIDYITQQITNVTNEYNNYYLQPGSIRVLGDEAVIIDTGTLVVKDDAMVNRITLGKLSSTLYGLKLDLLEGKYIQLDKDGMRVYDGTRNTVDISSVGNVTITGTINAEAGTLKNLTVTGNITAGDVTIGTAGISGSGYSLNASGITATAGAIAGWTIGATSITKGSTVIDSAAEQIRTTGAILGKYDATHYGISATAGKIGGWDIQSSALSTPNITIDSTNEKIDIAGIVTVGKYDTTHYGIKAGDVVLNGTGLSGTGYSLNASGVTATAGVIGGWTIGANSLTSGNVTISSATGVQKISIGTNISLNNDGSATLGKFSIATDGSISTVGGFSVNTSGQITATAGSIGTWTINENEITHAQIHLDATNDCIWMGAASIGTANIRFNSTGTATIGKLSLATDGSLDTGTGFKVDATGRLAATSGTIGGWDMTSSVIRTPACKNEVQYNTTTWAEWTKDAGITVGADGITLVGDHVNAIDISITTQVKASTKYGLIVNVAASTTIANFTILEGGKYGVADINIAPAFTGNFKTSFTTGSTITTNLFHSYLHPAELVGNSIKLKDIRLFELPVGSQIESDFTNLTADQLNTKYPIFKGTQLTSYATIIDSVAGNISMGYGNAVFGQYATGYYGMKIGNFVIDGTTGMLYVGTDSASAKFKINLSTGVATLDTVTLTNITSTSGKIGNWTIGANTLTAGTISLDATSGSEKIKITKTGDATKYVQMDGTGLNVVGGAVNIVTGISGTDNVTIDSTGIKAGGASVYAKLDSTGLSVVGGAISITTAVSGAKKLELKSTGIIATKDANNRVEIDGDGVRCIKAGSTLGAAITPDGIIGQLITDQSIIGTKFDKVAPAVPTNVNATQAVEQTATSEFINLTITWTAVADTDSDLAGYKIYLREGAGLYYPMAIVEKTATTYIIRNVKGNTQYYVAVTSYDLTGNESARSTDKAIMTTKDTVAPAKVAGFGTVDGQKMFYLKWNPVVYNWNSTTGTVDTSSVCNDLDYYEIQRKSELSGSTVEDWFTINRTYSTGVVDKDVNYEYDYSYRVRPVDLSGNYPQTSGAAEWATVAAGKAAKIGAADIVAGSITADVLNVGSMVKSINPMTTMLWHYDGVTTSTQDARPTSLQGGAWVDGKFGDGISLEEATTNMVSTATNGNAGFKNGTVGWTINGAVYLPTGGVGGSNDGCLTVTNANTFSLTLATTIGQTYAVSVYGRAAVFTELCNLVVTANGTEIMNSGVYSEWERIFYIYTADSASTTLVFKSSSAYTACVDNIQVENRGFVTAFTESYTLSGNVRAEGYLKYASDRLNPMKGILAFWFRPNRSGGSPNTSGQILWMWGEESVDNSKGLYVLEITNDNRPRLTIAGNGWSHTITHESAVNPMAWNEITIRWTFDTTLPSASRYSEIFLNGTESGSKIDLNGLVPPTMTVSTYTIGNHNDAGHSANGVFDELRIDMECLMDVQEKEEIISWYKQGSTFYDASSQIDADSQGISAANAKVTINNEGVTVRDGMMKVISDDGITLIGGGRINVNGINVGVVQSDNQVYNGNFSAPDTYYGMGDMYLSGDGIVGYGAKYWRSKRSSAWGYDISLMNATWNKYMVGAILDFTEIYTTLFNTYNASVRANEAINHTIETIMIQSLYATGAAAVIGVDAASGTNTVIVSSILWIPGQQVYLGTGSNRELLTIQSVVPASNAVVFSTNLTLSHMAGNFIIEKTLFDDTLEDEIVYQVNKSTNDKYDEWLNFGISAQRYNDSEGNPKYIGLRINPTTKALEYIPHTLNQWSGKFSLTIDPGTLLPAAYTATEGLGVYGHTKYEVWSKDTKFGKTGFIKLGVNTVHPDTTIDTSLQTVSVEQDLRNLITYTDGLSPEDTNWKQHVFSFWAKWENKPTLSQSQLTFKVDELVPQYTVDENNIATMIPSFKILTPDTTGNQNDMIINNTDFVNQKYQLALGHVSYDDIDDINSKTVDSMRYASILPLMKVRYIKNWINGSSANTSNHWTEIAAFDMTGTDIALGKTVTGSAGSFNHSNVVDGNMANFGEVTSGLGWMQIDLGSVQTLSAITIWHYFADGRTYNSNRTQVSEDGLKWYDIYAYNPMVTNSGYGYDWAETAQGWTIGGVTGMTPNPILVEEIFTAKGETDEGKAQWIIKTDGTEKGIGHPRYTCSTVVGDTMCVAFKGSSICDASAKVIARPENGTVYFYMDGASLNEVDPSYPITNIQALENKDIPAGNHVVMLVSTGKKGFNTTVENPAVAIEGLDIYDYRLISSDYSTTVVYEETNSSSWNKMVIKPNKCNTKASGTPLITAERVPIKYRVSAVLTKPEGDPYPCSVMVTDIQAELGENESFSRINYGVGGMPAYQITPWSQEIQFSGITTKHLQEFSDMHIQETGIYERHIANYQITTQKIAKSAVTSDVIAAGNVTFDKLAVSTKQRLPLNVSLDDYDYPIVLLPNTDLKIRYIAAEIQEGSEDIYKNGQLLFPDEDYTISKVMAAQHIVTMGLAASSGHTSTSIKLGATASTADDEYNGMTVVITGGTGIGQSKAITDYVGSTQTATIESAWTTTPDATTQYRIVDAEEYAYKVQMICDVAVTDKIWATYWQV